MKIPFKKAIASATMIATSYLANPNESIAQQPGARPAAVRTVENIIRLKPNDGCYSATGEGVFLKNFCYNRILTPDGDFDLYDVFETPNGDVTCSVVDAKEGLRIGLKYLENKPKTGENLASRKQIEILMRKTPQSNANSVSLLERAVSDCRIDTKGDGLYVDGKWKIEGGKYVFRISSKNQTVTDAKGNKTIYKAHSLPIIVDFSLNSDPDYLEGGRQAAGPTISTPMPSRDKIVADSLDQVRREHLRKAREEFSRDSIAAESRARKEEKERLEVSRSSRPSRTHTLSPRFGLEAAVGTNEEVVLGTFVELPAKEFSVQAYGNFYASGEPIKSNSNTVVTMREKELIGPGTYKQRTDEITTLSEDKPRFEFGVGASYKPNRRDFEFPVRVGLNFSKQTEKVEGKSTIIHERNMLPLGEPQVITNSMIGGKKNSTNLSLGVGAIYNVDHNWSVGASANRVGSKNSLRLIGRYRF